MIAKLKLAELTSQEAREALNGDAVILLPMGSLEDQGIHAPMGDYLAAEAVALDVARAARAMGIATFVAPVLPFGGRDHFDSSHGGISIRQTTLVALLDDMLGCLARHGLTKVLILNGHGGNVPPITDVAMRWRHERGMVVLSMYLWQIAYDLLRDILGPETAAKSSGHGGDPLTSMGLHYFPQILRPDLMAPPPTGLKAMGLDVAGYGMVGYGGARIHAPIEASETAPHGVWGGDPRLSRAETGAELARRLAEIGAGLIRDHVAKGIPA